MDCAASYTGVVEWLEPLSQPRSISHAVFDFDGTLSWLRHGWPELMFQVARPHFHLRPGETEQALHDSLLADILSLNGKPSIHQLTRCADRVRERGGIAPDPDSLLHEYQARLEMAIAERTHLIRAGEKPDQFVVHGARALLDRLHAAGITLVILSGTAEPRVREEAALLDLARYFGAHIYGSGPDVERSSKAAVIARLLREEGISGRQLLSFGDGPVELRLTRETGGVAVGVASDENHNGSGRIDELKRDQLRAAGAHVIIPDYRDGAAVMDAILAR